MKRRQILKALAVLPIIGVAILKPKPDFMLEFAGQKIGPFPNGTPIDFRGHTEGEWLHWSLNGRSGRCRHEGNQVVKYRDLA